MSTSARKPESLGDWRKGNCERVKMLLTRHPSCRRDPRRVLVQCPAGLGCVSGAEKPIRERAVDSPDFLNITQTGSKAAAVLEGGRAREHVGANGTKDA
jgi:hypothetical protein